MAPIPRETITMDDIQRWWQLQNQLKALKWEESILRKRIFSVVFPVPREGTNNAPFVNGFQFRATYTISREVDVAMLDLYGERLQQDYGVDTDMLFKYKPELLIKPYRELPEQQRIAFDQVLTIKAESPQLSIVPVTG